MHELRYLTFALGLGACTAASHAHRADSVVPIDRAGLERELLSAHAASLAAHLEGDWQWFGTETADPFLLVNDGIIRRASREDQWTRFRAYLQSVRFDSYADVIDPIVRVSDDGSMGWVIANVRARGSTRAGVTPPETIDQTWAWVMLYERQNGRWIRVANASNRLRGEVAPDLSTLPEALDAEVRTVLEAAQRAMGGAKALAAVETIDADAEVQSSKGPLRTRVFARKDGAVRFSQRTSQGVDVQWVVVGQRAWSVNADGTQAELGPLERSIATGHAFHLLVMAPTTYLRDPKSLGRQTFRGQLADVVEFRDSSGEPASFYYDAHSHLPMGYRIVEPGSSERTPIVVTLSEWRLHGTLNLFTRLHLEHGQSVFDYEYAAVGLNTVDTRVFESSAE